MADFDSSLPIKTQTDGDVVVKVSDGTTPSQHLNIDSAGKVTTKLNDGAGNAVTSQASGGQRALDVGINVAGTQIDPRQTRALTSADVVTVEQINQALPAGTNNIGKVSVQDSSGNAINGSNPLPVSVIATVGALVNDYKTDAAVAAAATANHDYTVTATKTLTLKKIHASASGKIKIEVQVSPDGTNFTTKWVAFNSSANPNIDIDLGAVGINVTGAGSKVRVIRTNRDNQSQDIYTTISGSEA